MEEIIQKIELLEKRVAELESTRLDNDMYSYDEVSKLSGKSIRTLKEYEKRGWLRAKFPNAKRRFSKQDLVRFLQG